MRGRVAHESIFNLNDGSYRCPTSQQGYSPFTTWTRGLAWIAAGYAEQLEFLDTLQDAELKPFGGRKAVSGRYLAAARATADFYIEFTPTDGVPYWDTGAPGLAHLGDYLDRPADPFNDHEPVDSSAAAIAAQGLIRLGNFLEAHGESRAGRRYSRPASRRRRRCSPSRTCRPSRSTRACCCTRSITVPNGWDHVPEGRKIPCGESSMWGDYHARELALLIRRMARDEPYYAFFRI